MSDGLQESLRGRGSRVSSHRLPRVFSAAAALLMVVALTPAGASPSPSTSVGINGTSSVELLTVADHTNPIELPRVADDGVERLAEEPIHCARNGP